MTVQRSRDAALVCAAGSLRAASVSLAGVLIALHLAGQGLSTSEIGLIIGVGMGANAAATVSPVYMAISGAVVGPWLHWVFWRRSGTSLLL